MPTLTFQPNLPADATDMRIVVGSGPEPTFDAVMQDFLLQSYAGLQRHQERGGLLEFACLGRRAPWLFRLTFGTRGYVRDRTGTIGMTERHVVALRFLPNYLRHADRFAMLSMIEPGSDAFHPNISPTGAICLEIYPGETLTEICHSLHELLRWRLRQFDERDALNPIACAWGRQHVDRPVDERPLFGQRPSFQWTPAAESLGGGR